MLADPAPAGGVDQPSMNALVQTAKQYNYLTIAHSISPSGFNMALDSGVAIITHAPLAPALDGGKAAKSAIARMVAERRICVPTLTMMEGIDEAKGGARRRLSAQCTGSVCPSLQAKTATKCPTYPAHLCMVRVYIMNWRVELLVGAGLSNLNELRSATVLPGQHFKMISERGVVTPVMRADLVLLSEDPLVDIKNTRSEFDPPAAA